MTRWTGPGLGRGASVPAAGEDPGSRLGDQASRPARAEGVELTGEDWLLTTLVPVWSSRRGWKSR
jgi:hypothetical protein